MAVSGSLCLVSCIHLQSVSCSSFLASLKAFCLSFRIEKNCTILALFVFSFGSCSMGVILALKHNRVPTNLRQNFMQNEALLVSGGWEVATVNTPGPDSAPQSTFANVCFHRRPSFGSLLKQTCLTS